MVGTFLLASVNANQFLPARHVAPKKLPIVVNNAESAFPILSGFVRTAVELALPLF